MSPIVFGLCFVFVVVGSFQPVYFPVANSSKHKSRRVNALDMNIHAKAKVACRKHLSKIPSYNRTQLERLQSHCDTHCQFRLSSLIYDNGSVIIPNVIFPFAHDVIASCNKSPSLDKNKCTAVEQIFQCVVAGVWNKIIKNMNQHSRTCASEQHDERVYDYNGFNYRLPFTFFGPDVMGTFNVVAIKNSCNYLCVLRKIGVVNGTNYPEFRKVEKQVPLKGMHVLRYEIIYRDCKSYYKDSAIIKKGCDRDVMIFTCFMNSARDTFRMLFEKMGKDLSITNNSLHALQLYSAKLQDKVYIEMGSQ